MRIDRFEGDYAVCEDENGLPVRVPRGALPPEAGEGTVLRLDNGRYTADPAATRLRREQLQKKRAALLGRTARHRDGTK